MYISTKDWRNFTDKLSKLNKTAGEKMVEYVQKNGFSDTNAIIDYAYGLATQYGEASAALSAEMYDTVAELSGYVIDPAEVAPTATYKETAKTVVGTLNRSQNPNSIGGAVAQLVKRAGADTMLMNAYRDRPSKRSRKQRHSGAQFAWIPSGDTCPFCLMLASKGWQNQTNWAEGHHADHIHSNCDCTYAVRFDEKTTVGGYDPDEYNKEWENAEGETRNEKINSLRRMQYQDPKIRAKINAQKRAAYAERQEMAYRHEKDNSRTITATTKESIINARQITGSPNGIYVSDKLDIKPKNLQKIEKNISESKKIIGIAGKEEPRIIIVDYTELGNAGGRYDAKTNTVYYKPVVDKKLEKHIIMHELYHWDDAQSYIREGNVIRSNSDIIDYMCVKGKAKLDKMGITTDNVSEISDYAGRMYRLGRFDEVYTEFRATKGLK